MKKREVKVASVKKKKSSISQKKKLKNKKI